MKEIRGVLPPLTTPIINDKIQVNKFHRNLELLKKHDLGGCLVLGSNGESVLLHEIEKVQLIKSARIVTPDDQTLIVGTGMHSVKATMRVCNIASEYGADVLLVITPYYFKKQMNDEAMIAFFTAIADKAKSPVMLYNVPKMTGVSISLEAVLTLSKHENIVGIKDSSGDLPFMLKLCASLPKDFQILCGNAGIFASALLAGAKGGILGIANAFPEPVVKIYKLIQDGKVTDAMDIQKKFIPTIQLIMGRLGVPGVKSAMDLRGLFGGEPRLPLLPCPDDDVKLIKESIELLVNEKLIPHKKIAM